MARKRTSQIRLWRQTQLVIDPKTKRRRPMTVPEAAAKLKVPVQTWYGWERKGSGPKSDELVVRLYRLSNGQLRPDHYYDLPDLRAEQRHREAVAAIGAAAANA